MAKADEHIVKLRVQNIAELLIKGHNREDIVQHSSENWQIGERQTDKYIQRAKELVEKSIQKRVEFDYSKAVRRYEELYKLSMERKDYKTALAVNKELTALQGLFKQQIEHSGEINFISSVPE